MGKIWPVQDAKARFSELLRAAEKEPQVITFRGEPKFELRLRHTDETSGKPRTLVDWWQSAPKAVELELPPRKSEKPRKVF